MAPRLAQVGEQAEEKMSQGQFQVKPVQHYEGAHYFAAPDDESSGRHVEEKPHPLTVTLLMLLVLGIGIGLIGCYMRTDYSPETPDSGPDGDPDGDPPGCDDGALRCVDDYVLEICGDGEWQERDCNEVCTNEEGFGYSAGCNAEADDPCQCEYDIPAGVPAVCSPSEVNCADVNTLEYCEDGEFVTQNCDDWCLEQYGDFSYSAGCDESADELCQCEYDILEGEPAMCLEGDLICIDEETAGICDSVAWDYVHVDCEDWCQETYGPDAHSGGCDESHTEPCICAIPDSGSGD